MIDPDKFKTAPDGRVSFRKVRYRTNKKKQELKCSCFITRDSHRPNCPRNPDNQNIDKGEARTKMQEDEGHEP